MVGLFDKSSVSALTLQIVATLVHFYSIRSKVLTRCIQNDKKNRKMYVLESYVAILVKKSFHYHAKYSKDSEVKHKW